MAQLITNWDLSVLLFIQEHFRGTALNAFWKFITLFGEYGIFWICVGLAVICFAKRYRAGLSCLLALGLGALLCNLILKQLIDRPRPFVTYPEIEPLITRVFDSSFPSGHSCASFACSVVLLCMLPKKYGIPALILALLVAGSRLALGVHYPSDVLAGALLGIFCAWLSMRILSVKKKQHPVNE